ncbi:MAG: hypothetical protein LBQ28_03880 [Prevotellaceae bacterium]|jgi:hypothetical protein|nr:hypothetical protein [Prevotellaceae bacterium]
MRLRILFGLFGLLYVCNAVGQVPLWVSRVPKGTATYYYRVSQGTGDTPEKAITKAFINVICESAFAVDLPANLEQLQKMPEDSVLVSYGKFSRIPVNKVCSYTELLITRTGYRAYVLCQVAKDVNIKPVYNTFNCLLNKEE